MTHRKLALAAILTLSLAALNDPALVMKAGRVEAGSAAPCGG
jgi:hypothetical protein